MLGGPRERSNKPVGPISGQAWGCCVPSALLPAFLLSFFNARRKVAISIHLATPPPASCSSPHLPSFFSSLRREEGEHECPPAGINTGGVYKVNFRNVLGSVRKRSRPRFLESESREREHTIWEWKKGSGWIYWDLSNLFYTEKSIQQMECTRLTVRFIEIYSLIHDDYHDLQYPIFVSSSSVLVTVLGV